MSRLKNFLLEQSSIILPSWIILLKDVFIVLFSFAAAYTLRNNFQLSDAEVKGMYLQMIPVGLLSAFIFKAMELNRGIIRHTGLKDIVRLLKAILILSSSIVLINALKINKFFPDFYYIPASVIIIFTFLSSMIIFLVRSAVKIFYYWLKDEGDSYNVLIYGAGNSGLLTKNLIQADQSRSIRVIGFVDNNPAKIGKSIEGVQVFSTGVFNPKFLHQNQVREVIFAIHNISKDRKRELIEELLQIPELTVKEVPPIESWINGQFSAKQIRRVEITDLLQRDEIVLSDINIHEHVNGKRVMVTGAAGSIGSEIVRQLCSCSPDVLIMVDQAETPMFHLENEIRQRQERNTSDENGFRYESLHFFIADVADHSSMKKLFSEFRPQIVYHAAAYKHVPMMERNPHEAVRVNILGTRNVADLASEYSVEKFVMISTDKAVNPTNVMGATKRAAEIYIQSLNNHLHSKEKKEEIDFNQKIKLNGPEYEHNTEDFKKRTQFITTRFGNVLGSNGSVIPLFEKQIAKGGPVTVTHPEVTRYFMTIPEACRLVLEASAMGQGGEIMMFDMGKLVRITDLAYNMIKLSGLEPNKDIKIVYTGLRPGEKLYEELFYEKEKGTKTPHPKIFIANTNPYPFREICSRFDDFHRMVNQSTLPEAANNNFNSNMRLVALIKDLIPEYKSNNSVFQQLDKKAEIRA